MNTDTQTLRHLLSTISYRLAKVIHLTDEKFWWMEFSKGVRKPIEILHHMSNVLAYVPATIESFTPEKSELTDWGKEIERFYKLLEDSDALLKKKEVEVEMAMKLIQGPLADILTHIGQLAMMRRLADAPMKGENFMKASIVVGKIKRGDQAFMDQQD